MSEKFCSQCGCQLKEGLKFCPKCGAPINIASNTMSSVISENKTGRQMDTTASSTVVLTRGFILAFLGSFLLLMGNRLSFMNVSSLYFGEETKVKLDLAAVLEEMDMGIFPTMIWGVFIGSCIFILIFQLLGYPVITLIGCLATLLPVGFYYIFYYVFTTEELAVYYSEISYSPGARLFIIFLGEIFIWIALFMKPIPIITSTKSK